MFSWIEPTECKAPLTWGHENKFQDSKESIEKHENWVGGDTKYFLVKIILQTISINEEVSAEESWHPKAEEEAFEINDWFCEKSQRGENSKPFEEFAIWQGAWKTIVGAFVAYIQSGGRDFSEGKV